MAVESSVESRAWLWIRVLDACLQLEFEEQTHAVAMTAVRLVGRMSRDWIQVPPFLLQTNSRAVHGCLFYT
eukprot:COSAG05_NODE_538_length_8854_cov_306.308738_13_plen_71_part_00